MDPSRLRKSIPPPRRAVTLEAALLSAMALALLAGLIALGFWQHLAAEHRARIVLGLSGAVIGCFAALLIVDTWKRSSRERTWLHAMSAWQQSSNARRMPHPSVSAQIAQSDLRQLAIQTYSRLGYRIAAAQPGEIYIRLINPRGQTELLACLQQQELVELHYLNSLHLEMVRTKAPRGFFWASAGFTSEAWKWAQHRPIVLADPAEMGRFLEAAHLTRRAHTVK